MKIITVKIGERIHIGDDITIEVTRIREWGRGGSPPRASIGIEAPKDMAIHRAELLPARERTGTDGV